MTGSHTWAFAESLLPRLATTLRVLAGQLGPLCLFEARWSAATLTPAQARGASRSELRVSVSELERMVVRNAIEAGVRYTVEA